MAFDAAGAVARGRAELGILTKDDYLPTLYLTAFIEALRTVGKQMQQDVIADAR